MKRCSTSYVTRELQIIISVRYYYTPIRTAKIQNTVSTKCWEGCGATGTLIYCGGNAKCYSHFLEDSLTVSYKIKCTLIIWSSNCTPYQNELKTYVHTKPYTQIFLAALFIIAKTWQQPRCPSTDKWMKKLWQIQTVEYYSALKRNDLSSHEKTWRNL